ncbi:MAG: DUF3037 domain-containing protein [Caldilineaceae bacterium]|nr:DUF3037 domain-containing protein [Caldilineaceae bacterium]
MPADCSYDYAVIRVVPYVDREEFVNAGVVVFSRTQRYLAAAVELDVDRLHALAPDIDIAAIEEQLALSPRICAGNGPIGQMSQAEIFHWIVAPHSTAIQCSPVHSGLVQHPATELPAVLEHLMDTFVRPRSNRLHHHAKS